MKREKLIKFRENKKMTQKEMADKLGISFTMYQALEYNLRDPSLKTLNKFKKVFPDIKINNIFLT